jgi:quercetin 2,3-dioxygenase
VLHGVQLWVALPHARRDMPPAFAHHPDLPVVEDGGLAATVLIGDLAGVSSPAESHTPLTGAEIRLGADAAASLPLRPDWEYAVLALEGAALIGDVTVKPGPLIYLGSGRSSLALSAASPARLLLLGGEPFEERLVMWWNFVGRAHDEIVEMRADWESQTPRFGEVRGYDGPRLPAPPMPLTRLVARGRVR